MSGDIDLILEAFAEFLNGVEASVQSAKSFLKKIKVNGSDPSKITWTQAQGSKGPYERAAQQTGTDYQLLVKDLSEHGGRMNKGGMFFWLFEDGTTIGRKKVQKKEGSQKTIDSATAPVSQPGDSSRIVDVEAAFPADLHGLLSFQVEGDFVTIRPRQYLGSDNFRKIAAIVRDQLAGEYISDGQNSRFRIKRSN